MALAPRSRSLGLTSLIWGGGGGVHTLWHTATANYSLSDTETVGTVHLSLPDVPCQRVQGGFVGGRDFFCAGVEG